MKCTFENYRATADEWIIMSDINDTYTTTDTDESPRMVYDWLLSIMLEEVDKIESEK